MVKLSKESLEAFQSVLETVDTSWQTEFNLRETVRQSFELIKKAKEHKVSWDKIAEVLKQSSGVTDGISPESIRQYYFEFLKNPDLLPKKKRKASQVKDKAKVSKSDVFIPKIEEAKPETSDTNQLTASESESEPELEALSASESNPQPVSELPNATSQGIASEPNPEPSHPAKDDVRSQFNLSRRGK